jgi:hypothetical protein
MNENEEEEEEEEYDDDDDYDDERIIRKLLRILQPSVHFTPSIPSPSAGILSAHSKWLEPHAISLKTIALSVDHKPVLSSRRLHRSAGETSSTDSRQVIVTHQKGQR